MTYLNDTSQWQATRLPNVIIVNVTIFSVVFDPLIISIVAMFVYLSVDGVIVTVASCHLLNELLECGAELLLFRVAQAIVEGLEDDDSKWLNQLTQRNIPDAAPSFENCLNEHWFPLSKE